MSEQSSRAFVNIILGEYCGEGVCNRLDFEVLFDYYGWRGSCFFFFFLLLQLYQLLELFLAIIARAFLPLYFKLLLYY